MFGSSESWGPQQHPLQWHFRAGGGAVHSIKSGPTHRSKNIRYSITSSARASSVGGTSMPSAFAALRLMANSYLVRGVDGQLIRPSRSLKLVKTDDGARKI